MELIKKIKENKVKTSFLAGALLASGISSISDNLHLQYADILNPGQDHYIIGIGPRTNIKCESEKYVDFSGETPKIKTFGLFGAKTKIKGDCSKIEVEQNVLSILGGLSTLEVDFAKVKKIENNHIGIFNLLQDSKTNLKVGRITEEVKTNNYGISFINVTGNNIVESSVKGGIEANTYGISVFPFTYNSVKNNSNIYSMISNFFGIGGMNLVNNYFNRFHLTLGKSSNNNYGISLMTLISEGKNNYDYSGRSDCTKSNYSLITIDGYGAFDEKKCDKPKIIEDLI